MYKKSARRSSLFLLELMISILMFSVASAWCVRLFVTVRSVVVRTEEQNRGQNLAAGYAELFLASGNFEAFLLQEGAEQRESGEITRYYLGYDRNGNVCKRAEAYFAFDIAIEDKEDFSTCYFSFRRADEKEDIYTLEVEKYTGGEDVL